MKDETFSRFALCVSDHYNRVGFAVLCDLECKTLVYKNARTRTMLERITIAAGRQSDYAAGTDERAACDYQGKDFIRAFQLADSDVEKLSQMLRIRDYTRFKQFCANFTLNGDIERARLGKSNLLVSFEGYTSTPAASLLIDDYHSCGLTLPPFDELRHWVMDRFDLWMLPGANPTEKTPHASTAARSCG